MKESNRIRIRNAELRLERLRGERDIKRERKHSFQKLHKSKFHSLYIVVYEIGKRAPRIDENYAIIFLLAFQAVN